MNPLSGSYDADGESGPTAPVAATALDWKNDVDLHASDASFAKEDVKVSFGGGVPDVTIDRTGPEVTVSGTLSNFNIGKLVTNGSAGFSVSEVGVGVHLAGGDLSDARLLKVGLTNVGLTFGDPAGAHFTTPLGSLRLAAIGPSDAQAATDSRRWLALNGGWTGPPIALGGVGGPFTGSVSDPKLELNSASGGTA